VETNAVSTMVRWRRTRPARPRAAPQLPDRLTTYCTDASRVSVAGSAFSTLSATATSLLSCFCVNRVRLPGPGRLASSGHVGPSQSRVTGVVPGKPNWNEIGLLGAFGSRAVNNASQHIEAMRDRH